MLVVAKRLASSVKGSAHYSLPFTELQHPLCPSSFPRSPAPFLHFAAPDLRPAVSAQSQPHPYAPKRGRLLGTPPFQTSLRMPSPGEQGMGGFCRVVPVQHETQSLLPGPGVDGRAFLPGHQVGSIVEEVDVDQIEGAEVKRHNRVLMHRLKNRALWPLPGSTNTRGIPGSTRTSESIVKSKLLLQRSTGAAHVGPSPDAANATPGLKAVSPG